MPKQAKVGPSVTKATLCLEMHLYIYLEPEIIRS